MILACHNIEKAFGEEVIVSGGSFHIEDHEKAALVGPNGAGKTTLLKMIVGEIQADGGNIVLTRGKTMGYLAQHQDMNNDHTIYQEVRTAKADILDMERQIREIEQEMKHLSGERLEERMNTYQRLTAAFERENGYACESEITGVLKGLGFTEEEFAKPVATLSGGQKTRVSLGKLLLTKPDILLLDEPTNHLDLNSISWLETYLLNYPGAVLIVSHDRYFLNRVVTKVVEIELGKLTTFMGNYTDYAKKKEMLREARMKEYLNQQQEIKHQEAVIEKLKSFNREKSIKRAESREKQLAKIDVLERPQEEKSEMHMTLTPSIISGNDVLRVEGLSKAYENKKLFQDISFEIKRGERVALIGQNGTGKTTMALAFSRAMRLKETRVQFTPDVLPADLTGFSIYQKETGQFVYQPGAVMCNILLADEINRTSPKTQSALLEVMEEKQVTIDGVTRRTGDPFIVIATENPVGSAGTQLLPESQLDRFMICVKMGYPSVEEEIEILRRAQSGEAVENVFPILEQTVLLLLQKEVREVFVHERIYRYIAELAKATRENEWTELGISTRGTVALTKMAKAAAYLQGRNYVILADVMDVFEDVAIHRIILNMKAKVGHIRTEELIRRIVEQVRQPSLQKRR